MEKEIVVKPSRLTVERLADGDYPAVITDVEAISGNRVRVSFTLRNGTVVRELYKMSLWHRSNLTVLLTQLGYSLDGVIDLKILVGKKVMVNVARKVTATRMAVRAVSAAAA